MEIYSVVVETNLLFCHCQQSTAQTCTVNYRRRLKTPEYIHSYYIILISEAGTREEKKTTLIDYQKNI